MGPRKWGNAFGAVLCDPANVCCSVGVQMAVSFLDMLHRVWKREPVRKHKT